MRTPRGEAREVRARANVSVGVVRGPSVKYRFQPTLDDAIKKRAEEDSKALIANGTGKTLTLWKKSNWDVWDKVGGALMTIPGLVLTLMTWRAFSQWNLLMAIWAG